MSDLIERLKGWVVVSVPNKNLKRDLHEAADALKAKDKRIAKLEAERDALIPVAAQPYPLNYDAVCKDNARLRAVYETATNLRDRIEPRSKGGIADEYYALDAALAAAEGADNPCATGHDFRDLGQGGTARCRDCGELADCAETGAVKEAKDEKTR